MKNETCVLGTEERKRNYVVSFTRVRRDTQEVVVEGWLLARLSQHNSVEIFKDYASKEQKLLLAMDDVLGVALRPSFSRGYNWLPAEAALIVRHHAETIINRINLKTGELACTVPAKSATCLAYRSDVGDKDILVVGHTTGEVSFWHLQDGCSVLIQSLRVSSSPIARLSKADMHVYVTTDEGECFCVVLPKKIRYDVGMPPLGCPDPDEWCNRRLEQISIGKLWHPARVLRKYENHQADPCLSVARMDLGRHVIALGHPNGEISMPVTYFSHIPFNHTDSLAVVKPQITLSVLQGSAVRHLRFLFVDGLVVASHGKLEIYQFRSNASNLIDSDSWTVAYSRCLPTGVSIVGLTSTSIADHRVRVFWKY